MKLNIAICDDMIVFCNELQNKLNRVAELKDSKIYTFATSFEFIESTKEIVYDIIFMDVELDANISGLHVSSSAKNVNPECLIIYISSHNEYFPEMVLAEPFYFLRKPVNDGELHKALKKAFKRINLITNQFSYTYKFNGVQYSVNLHDLMYFESEHRIIRGFLADGNVIEFYDKMDNVEKDVDKIYPYFLRVNKSYLVNYHHCHIKAGHVLVNDITIKKSRNYKESFNKKYMNIIKDIRM